MNRARLAFFFGIPAAVSVALLGGACNGPLTPAPNPTTSGTGGADGGVGGAGGATSSATGDAGDGGLPAHCSNGLKDEDETGYDCGGKDCPACGIDSKCAVSGDCPSNNCQGGVCVCPTGMLPVPGLNGTKFCIDATEVTVGAYQVFHDTTNVNTGDQDPWCLWNVSFTPKTGWPPPADGSQDDEPVRYVNWCQAFQYCKSSGLHLCGAIGGGSVPLGSATDPKVDQWYNACSAQGSNDYPYGSPYQQTTCNGVDAAQGAPWPVTTKACAGGTSTALYDMSGNVGEWEDSCSGGLDAGADAGPNETCLVRGGSFLSGQADLRCDAVATEMARNYAGADVGFRCCL
jgi:hypothetical protein